MYTMFKCSEKISVKFGLSSAIFGLDKVNIVTLKLFYKYLLLNTTINEWEKATTLP